MGTPSLNKTGRDQSGENLSYQDKDEDKIGIFRLGGERATPLSYFKSLRYFHTSSLFSTIFKSLHLFLPLFAILFHFYIFHLFCYFYTSPLFRFFVIYSLLLYTIVYPSHLFYLSLLFTSSLFHISLPFRVSFLFYLSLLFASLLFISTFSLFISFPILLFHYLYYFLIYKYLIPISLFNFKLFTQNSNFVYI